MPSLLTSLRRTGLTVLSVLALAALAAIVAVAAVQIAPVCGPDDRSLDIGTSMRLAGCAQKHPVRPPND